MAIKNKDLSIPSVIIKDFFLSTNNGSRKNPENPHNYKWLLEENKMNFSSEIYNKTLNHLNEKIQSNTLLSYEDKKVGALPKLKDIITDENIVLKRMEVLFKLGADLKNEGIAIARIGSVPIFKLAVELGDLDINYFHNGNYPIRTAFMRKHFKLAHYLWDLPNIKKDYTDMEDNLLLHTIVLSKDYSKVIDIWEKERDLFFYKTPKGKVLLDTFFVSKKNFLDIPEKYVKDIHTIFLDMLYYYNNSSLIEDNIKFKERLYPSIPASVNNPDSSEDLKLLWIQYNYEKLSKKLDKERKPISVKVKI